MLRYELAPEGNKLVEAEDGPWLFYWDVEWLLNKKDKRIAELEAQLVESERLRTVAVERADVVEEQLAEARGIFNTIAVLHDSPKSVLHNAEKGIKALAGEGGE